MRRSILVIGPLPPPYGGARVSFELYFDFLKRSTTEILHFDLPIRDSRQETPPGDVNHRKTLRGVLGVARRLGSSRRLVIFGSKNFCFSYGILLLLLSRMVGTPVSIRFFGGHPAGTLKLRGLMRSIAMRLMALAERIVVETQVAVTEFPEFLRDKLQVVHAYRLARRDGRPDPDVGRDLIQFVYVGHVTAEKGIPLLVSAISSIQKNEKFKQRIELHVYGSGDPEVVESLRDVPGIHYHGRVSQDQLVDELLFYDVMVFPSVYSNEGHPGAVVEALVAGLPVIASDLTGPLEILGHEMNALIVKSGDEVELADAIRRIAEDRDLRSRLAEGARASGRQFDAEIVLPKLSESLGITESDPDS